MAEDKNLVIAQNREIQNMIYTIRNKQVMVDSDLAELYQVTTGRLNEQVKRNLNRFPSRFMFQLTDDEYKSLISQNAISKKGRGGRRTSPYVFTEQGIAMLSTVLKSDIAVDVSIKIMDAFVEMRNFLLSNGNFGSRSARVLLERYPHEALIFTAQTKNGLEKYQAMGIETRIVDFNNAEKLMEAFKDADTVILISMPFVGPKRREAHKIAIDAAVAAGVSKLVYTSIVGAGHEDINAYEVNDHVWTERYIKKQPIHYLILRDSQYAEAMVSTFVEAVENTNGIIRNNMGDGKMAFVSRDDCALAAACAAMSDWEDRIVDINGAELLTIAQYMAIASEVTGKKTEYQYINDDEMYEFFDSIGVPRTTEEMWADTAKNFPFCSDGMVSFGRAIRLNQMSTFTDDFEKLTGQKPITVREMFEDIENHLIGTRTSTDN